LTKCLRRDDFRAWAGDEDYRGLKQRSPSLHCQAPHEIDVANKIADVLNSSAEEYSMPLLQDRTFDSFDADGMLEAFVIQVPTVSSSIDGKA
jgi:hypothetical protein